MKTIIWDIDDVLNDLMHQWFNNYKFSHNLCIVDNYEEIIDNPPYELFNISKDNYLHSLDIFRKQNFKLLKPKKEILDWFEQYGSITENIVLTATPISCVSYSAEWLFRYFGEWIISFHFIPSYRNNSYETIYYKNKGELIKSLNKKDIIFIEDNEKNIREAKKLNPDIKTFCVKQPWNTGRKVKDILEELTELIK